MTSGLHGSAPEADAAFWAVRLDASARDPAVQAGAEAWLAADPRRAGELLRAQAVLQVMTGRALRQAPQPARAPAAFPRRRLLRAGGLLAASVALGVALLPRSGRIATEVGEIRQVPLADGSTASLNTATTAQLQFSGRERRIDLPRGEALFRVAKAAGRPFVVVAGAVRVIALGTVFAVRHRSPGVEVLVVEGRVEVQDSDRLPVTLAAGERGLFGTEREAEVAPVAPEAAARALAWRDGRLEFGGETAAEAIAEVNRHNRRQIRLLDGARAAEPVFGAFRTDDPAGFARALGTMLDLPVDERPREILVGSADGGRPGDGS